jgi:hypothetical protein
MTIFQLSQALSIFIRNWMVLTGFTVLVSINSFLNVFLASDARQAEGITLVGKHGWEVWGCGQAGRFASLSIYPHRPPAYPSSRSRAGIALRLFGFSLSGFLHICQ